MIDTESLTDRLMAIDESERPAAVSALSLAEKEALVLRHVELRILYVDAFTAIDRALEAADE